MRVCRAYLTMPISAEGKNRNESSNHGRREKREGIRTSQEPADADHVRRNSSII